MTETIKPLPFIIKQDSITVVFADGPKTVRKDNPNFSKIFESIKTGTFDLLEDLFAPAKSVINFTGGSASIKDGCIYYGDMMLNSYLSNKILQFKNEGLPWEHLMKFLDKLMANPSMRAREELYKFLELEDLPITEDGFFLAYKSVRSTMMDWHSNTMDNGVGKVVEVPRQSVDDNQGRGCSTGLHAGSLKYVSNFHPGDSVQIIVKIDPADVVCIPSEDCSKLRCCRYEVISMFTAKLEGTLYNSSGTTQKKSSDYEDTYEDDEEEDYYIEYSITVSASEVVADSIADILAEDYGASLQGDIEKDDENLYTFVVSLDQADDNFEHEVESLGDFVSIERL